MSLQHHIDKLVAEHKALDKEIEKLETSGHFDDMSLRALKKRKLQLKDEIDRFRESKSNVAKLRKVAGAR